MVTDIESHMVHPKQRLQCMVQILTGAIIATPWFMDGVPIDVVENNDHLGQIVSGAKPDNEKC